MSDLFLELPTSKFGLTEFNNQAMMEMIELGYEYSKPKLEVFKDRSVAYGNPICYKQTWNEDSQKKYMTINRLSDLIGRCFG